MSLCAGAAAAQAVQGNNNQGEVTPCDTPRGYGAGPALTLDGTMTTEFGEYKVRALGKRDTKLDYVFGGVFAVCGGSNARCI